MKKISTIRVAQALAMAAAVSRDEVCEDIVCLNNVQNIYVVSTPEEMNARAYEKVQQICLRAGVFEVAAYMAASDNTCKGVVRGVNAEFSDASFRRCRPQLVQFIKALEPQERPHVILLQDTGIDTINLPGYRAVSSLAESGRGIATLVAKKCAFQEQDLRLGKKKLEALLVEIIPNSWLKDSVYVLNVYCSPRDNRHTFYNLTTKASSKARETPLVMVGDLNAPHQAWVT